MNHISFKKPAIQGYGSRLRSFRTPNGAFPIRGRLALSVLLIFVSIIFSSCNFNKPEKGSLLGTWVTDYGDGYIITETTVTYDDGEFYESDWGTGGIYGWTAKILEKSDSSSGYIQVQYTSVEEGLNNELLGKFITIHFKNLTENSIQLANAYKATGLPYAETLEQAKTEFTVENSYFDRHGEYVKK